MIPLVFQLSVVKDKPQSYRKDKKKNVCPICDVASLTDIYKKEDDIIWLHNKYQLYVILFRLFNRVERP